MVRARHTRKRVRTKPHRPQKQNKQPSISEKESDSEPESDNNKDVASNTIASHTLDNIDTDTLADPEIVDIWKGMDMEEINKCIDDLSAPTHAILAKCV